MTLNEANAILEEFGIKIIEIPQYAEYADEVYDARKPLYSWIWTNHTVSGPTFYNIEGAYLSAREYIRMRYKKTMTLKEANEKLKETGIVIFDIQNNIDFMYSTTYYWSDGYRYSDYEFLTVKHAYDDAIKFYKETHKDELSTSKQNP